MKATSEHVLSLLDRMVLCLLCLAVSAAPGVAGQQSGNVVLWVEREVAIPLGDGSLYGILALPASGGPHPAVAIITGAAGTEGRAGASARTHVDHAHSFAAHGFACLRYDPPGVGRSPGKGGPDTLETRAEEALAVARFLQQQPDISRERVGLWGVSQGGWVIAMAASDVPDTVVFLIMVSGTIVSAAEQQVYGVEMQSRAAGVAGDDLAKAVLVSRLLIDWQVPSPIFAVANRADLLKLGDGPWSEFAGIVYGEDALTVDAELAHVIAVLEAMSGEPWAVSLHLADIVIPTLRCIPPDSAADLIDAAAADLLANPASYFERVGCPTLALFGEDDALVPVGRSVALLEESFEASGNDDLTIVVFPDAGHSLNDFMPAYWEAVSSWLDDLCGTWDSEGD